MVRPATKLKTASKIRSIGFKLHVLRFVAVVAQLIGMQRRGSKRTAAYIAHRYVGIVITSVSPSRCGCWP